ncbi:MAG: radical SAM protein [Desulfurococcaceae archaeon]
MTIVFKPGMMFPAISITGDSCSLNCIFCKRRFIKNMLSADNPNTLSKLLDKLVKKGVRGVLISGGFNRDGYLPIEPYLPVIKHVKKKYDLVVCIHTGLPNAKIIDEISFVEVDVIDYEFTLDQEYVSEMRGLGRNIDDYIEVMDYMLQNKLKVVPHVPMGFTNNYDAVLKAINYLSKRNVDNIVFVVNVDSKNPQLQNLVLNVLGYARENFSREISLGCMRPYWLKKTIDKIVIEEKLVDRIVNPIGEYPIIFEACCSIPRNLLVKFIRNREYEN